MLIYCYKCLNLHKFNDKIPPSGKQFYCLTCGCDYTLYPSKVIIGNFHDYVLYNADISGRARSILLRNVFTVNQFLSLIRGDFLRFKNCGSKTANELIEFKITLCKKLGLISGDKELNKKLDVNMPTFLKNDVDLFEIIVDKLSTKSYQLFVNKYQINSLEKLMALKTENLINMKNCGYKKIREVKQIQNTISQVVKMVQSQKDIKFNDFKSMIEADQNIRKLFGIGDNIDPQTPFPSLDSWISNISNNSKRNKNVFMLRMGMLGKSSQTYQQIALIHDISRERVRMIVEKLKKAGQKSIYRLRLDPLIEQTERIVRSSGGKIAFQDLIPRLFEKGPQGELLKYAVPFIEYLKEFPRWEKTGLKIKNGYIVIESNSDF